MRTHVISVPILVFVKSCHYPPPLSDPPASNLLWAFAAMSIRNPIVLEDLTTRAAVAAAAANSSATPSMAGVRIPKEGVIFSQPASQQVGKPVKESVIQSRDHYTAVQD